MTQDHTKLHGVVYTPDAVVRRICDNVLPSGHELAKTSICDPACGDGAFLVTVARRILRQLPRRAALRVLSRMTGYDIDPKAINICRKRLQEVLCQHYPGATVKWRLLRRDALDRNAFRKDYKTFTHVLGNPPYIRVQHLGRDRRKRLGQQWRVARGSTDFYLLFYELGLDLLQPSGLLGYITPASWLRTSSGKALRTMLASEHRVRKILNYGNHQVFDKVTAYTAITIIEKQGAPQNIPCWRHNGVRFINAGTIPAPSLTAGQPWIASTRADRTRMRHLAKNGLRLGDIAHIHVGIQTLADKVFILPVDNEKSSTTKTVQCNTESGPINLERWMLRPILKASVMKNGKDPVRRVIIYPYDSEGCLIPEKRIANDAPKIWEWLQSQRTRLLARDKGATDPVRWYGYGRDVSIVSGFGEKILSSGMNLKPNFQLCPDPDATFYSGYCIKPKLGINLDIQRFLQVLNSDDMDFFIRKTSQPYQGGWMSYAKSFIQEFPVPENIVLA